MYTMAKYKVVCMLSIIVVLTTFSCSPLKKIDCPDGPVYVPRKPVPYPSFVKTADLELKASISAAKAIDSAQVTVNTRKKLQLLRDTLSEYSYLIDNSLYMAKNLADSRPCDSKYASDYLQMLNRIQSEILPRLKNTQVDLTKVAASSNFGKIDEAELQRIINEFFRK
jgi:hypothetical protein